MEAEVKAEVAAEMEEGMEARALQGGGRADKQPSPSIHQQKAVIVLCFCLGL